MLLYQFTRLSWSKAPFLRLAQSFGSKSFTKDGYAIIKWSRGPAKLSYLSHTILQLFFPLFSAFNLISMRYPCLTGDRERKLNRKQQILFIICVHCEWMNEWERALCLFVNATVALMKGKKHREYTVHTGLQLVMVIVCFIFTLVFFCSFHVVFSCDSFFLSSVLLCFYSPCMCVCVCCFSPQMYGIFTLALLSGKQARLARKCSEVSSFARIKFMDLIMVGDVYIPSIMGAYSFTDATHAWFCALSSKKEKERKESDEWDTIVWRNGTGKHTCTRYVMRTINKRKTNCMKIQAIQDTERQRERERKLEKSARGDGSVHMQASSRRHKYTIIMLENLSLVYAVAAIVNLFVRI